MPVARGNPELARLNALPTRINDNWLLSSWLEFPIIWHSLCLRSKDGLPCRQRRWHGFASSREIGGTLLISRAHGQAAAFYSLYIVVYIEVCILDIRINVTGCPLDVSSICSTGKSFSLTVGIFGHRYGSSQVLLTLQRDSRVNTQGKRETLKRKIKFHFDSVLSQCKG